VARRGPRGSVEVTHQPHPPPWCIMQGRASANPRRPLRRQPCATAPRTVVLVEHAALAVTTVWRVWTVRLLATQRARGLPQGSRARSSSGTRRRPARSRSSGATAAASRPGSPFGEVHHAGSVSPAWPLAYSDFELLREAEQAHGAYEATLGHPDDNWPAWYARHIMERLAEAQGST
jgi:hypothetical protein